MAIDQSKDAFEHNNLVQANTRIEPHFDALINRMAKANHRNRASELRMLLEVGFKQVYGFDPLKKVQNAA